MTMIKPAHAGGYVSTIYSPSLTYCLQAGGRRCGFNSAEEACALLGSSTTAITTDINIGVCQSMFGSYTWFAYYEASCPVNSTNYSVNPAAGLCLCNLSYMPDSGGTGCVLEPLTVALSGLGGVVMPTKTQAALAYVTTISGLQMSGVHVDLSLTVVPENGAPIRAEYVGNVSPNGGATGADGRLNFVFTAPTAGGLHTITATCTGCTNIHSGTITEPGCPVDDLPPITDTEVQTFENNPNRSDTDRLTQRMGMAAGPPQGALLCLRNAIRDAGGTSTVGSAFRPPAYNQHMIDVWDKWMDELRRETNPACQSLRSRVEAHFNRHGMVHRPAPNSRHTLGEAFDLTSSLPDTTLDALAEGCQVYRNIPATDRVHFIHR